MVIHLGKRKETVPRGQSLPVELYHLRANGSPLCTRLVQIRPDASTLNSAFWSVVECFIKNIYRFLNPKSGDGNL